MTAAPTEFRNMPTASFWTQTPEQRSTENITAQINELNTQREAKQAELERLIALQERYTLGEIFSGIVLSVFSSFQFQQIEAEATALGIAHNVTLDVKNLSFLILSVIVFGICEYLRHHTAQQITELQKDIRKLDKQLGTLDGRAEISAALAQSTQTTAGATTPTS